MPRKRSIAGHETARALLLPINYCFVCGKDNPEGMRLKFSLDEEGKRVVGRIRLSRRYTGPPGHAHGGIIASILDEAMGKVNRLRRVSALTSEMSVRYLKPVPLNQPLLVEGRELRVRGRLHVNVAAIRNQGGEVLAASEGKFIAVDPHRMFKKHLKVAKNGMAPQRRSAAPRSTKN